MPAYPFNATLIPSVLTDQTFIQQGIYTGNSGGIEYAVIDPRRHNIDVWSKFDRQPTFRPPRGSTNNSMAALVNGVLSIGNKLSRIKSRVLFKSRYKDEAEALGSHYFTNGPMMGPTRGNGRLAQTAYVLLPTSWIPFARVIRNGRVVTNGKGFNSQYFGRTGQGDFSKYVIAPDPATGLEAIGGLIQVIANSAIVTNPSTLTITASVGICCWGLRPIAPAVNTTTWTSRRAWLLNSPTTTPSSGSTSDDAGTPANPQPPPNALILHGVIVVAASAAVGVIPVVPTAMLSVGVTNAVAMDASDSVMVGQGSTTKIACSTIKDRIQIWGFCCK